MNSGCGHSNPPDRDIRQTPLLNDVSSSYFSTMFLALCAHLLQLIGHSPAATATKYSWELVAFQSALKPKKNGVEPRVMSNHVFADLWQMTFMTSLQRGLHKRERARQQVRSRTKGGILHIGNSIRQHHNANACTKCARKKIVVLPLFPWKMLKDIVKDVHTSHTKAWKTQISISK